jgi:Porin subfamily
VLAYTFSSGAFGFWPGFSATISVEDSHERFSTAQPFGLATGAFPGGVFPGTSFAPLGFTQGGERVPDVVGNIKYAGTWGGAQLSGAVTQIRDTSVGFTTVGGVTVPVLNPITGLPNPAFADTEYGFAVMGTAYYNLPWLGAGDAAWIAATYTNGAPGYILGSSSQNQAIGLRAFQALPVASAFVDPITGDFDNTVAWSIAGGLTHNWTPQFRSSIFGSYARFEYGSGAAAFVPVNDVTLAAGTAGTVVGFPDFNEYRIGANTFWTPVSGLNIGVEVLYAKIDPKGRVAVPQFNLAGVAANPNFFVPRSDADVWEGRLRIQRDF